MKNKSIQLLLLSLFGLSLISILLAACTRPGGISDSGTNSDNSLATTSVHMGMLTFTEPSITIKKGSSLLLMDDVSVPHDILNGSWVNSIAQTRQETGAPTVRVQLVGNDSQSVGPFNTVGTFHLYCSVHPGMNLTVIVQ